MDVVNTETGMNKTTLLLVPIPNFGLDHIEPRDSCYAYVFVLYVSNSKKLHDVCVCV